MIKELLRKHINELNITPKPEYGHGIEHRIYKSNSNPNILFKVGHKTSVMRWLDIFMANPEYFPIVYKNGKLKDTDEYYVEVEKLDTDRVRDEWRQIDQQLKEAKDKGMLAGLTRDDSIEDIWMLSERTIILIANVIAQNNDEELALLFYYWTKFLKEVESIVTKEGHYLDCHVGNFGYDKAGNKKCLDF